MVTVAEDRLPASNESVYVLPGEISAQAITNSLQALLPTRRHLIARHRFTVLDTFDGRVRRSGARLTRSRVNGHSVVVALQTGSGGSRLSIPESQAVSFAWDFPEGPLQRAVAAVIGPRRLLEQADAEEYGSLLDVLDHRDKTVARLRIASGQARLPMSPGAWQRLPTMVTLTGLRGYEEAFAQLVPVIESRPGLEACPEGALGVMLQRVGVPALNVSSLGVGLAPTVRADLGARQIHQALLRILRVNEPGLRANLDSEFLHDFRVAVRRTRSLLGQIRHVFPPDVVQHFSTEFSWLGRLTGPPRDLDVLILALRERADACSPADKEALIGWLNQAQQHEHSGLVQALDSDRYRRLFSDWMAFLERPADASSQARNASSRLATVVSRRACA